MKTYLITLSLLILAVIVLRALFRRSVSQRVIYALWIVVLLRICLPFQIFAVEVPNFFVPEDVPQGEITLAPDTTAAPYITETFTPSVTTSSVIIPIPSVTEEPSSPGNIPWESVAPITPVTPSESVESIPGAVTPETPKTEINIPWKTVAYTAWTAGSLIFLLSLGASALSFSRRLKADRRYYMSLGKTKVYVSKAAGSPMLWGLVPVIYLAPDMGKDEAYSLVHEQTHLRHGDHIWSIVRALVLALFWWNPLVWAAVYLSKQDAELACDEAIASRLDDGARLEYAKVIVDNIPRKGTLATGLASAPIKERIIMITKKNKTRALSLLLVLTLTFASVGCSFIGPKDPTPSDVTIDPGNLTPPDGDDKTPDIKESGIGPFVGYVESDTAEYIDVYTNENGEKLAGIPWNVIADFPATEKAAGLLPYKIWYGEKDDFVWAVVAGGVHLGSDNRNFCISRDGGKTWEIGEMAVTWSGITTSAIFISEDIGFMGYERGAYDGIVIARTEDGGKSWERVKIEIPTGLADYQQTTPRAFDYNGKILTCTISLENGVGPDTSVDILSKDNGVTWEYEYNWSGKIGTYHTVISNTGTREAHLIPAAMYGYGVGDGIAYTSYETNTKSYWTTLNAGSDIGFWAVFGMQNDYKAQGDFDGYVTYRISALNGRVVAHDIVETFTKELVLEKGKIYSGELKGTYKAKAFSRGDGLTSYTFLFNNGNIELSAYRAGSGAGGTYNGTYTYDKTSGKLSANLSFTTVENGMTKTSFGHNFTAKVYEYDGFIHFIITDSGLSMMESGAPLPISFKMADRPGDFDMMANILINGALTEKQLAGEAVSDEVIRSFIGYTCVSYYRENGFIYSGYWKLIDNNMTLYMSAEDAAKIAYEVFGVENYNGGEIKIPYGVGLGSGNGWSAIDTTIEQNSDTVVYRCTLVGDEMNESSEKVFGNYRFTFKYITEGERGFWRYVGAEEINDENIGHLISENYNVQISSDEKTIRVQKIGESDALVISCGEEKDGVHYAAFLPGSVKLTVSEDENALLLTYTSYIDQRREGATLYDLEAKQVRSHYLPTPEEIIKVNDPTGELAKKFQPYYDSGEWQISCSAKADGRFIDITYQLSCKDMMFSATSRVASDSYYGHLRSGIAVTDAKAREFLGKFELAKELSSWFYHASNLYEYTGTEKFTEWHGYTYLHATNPILAQNDITDIPSLKAYFESVFTKEIVDYFMVMCADEENVSKSIAIPYIAHFDGKLWGYYSVAGNRYGMPELFTIEESVDRVTLVYRHYDTAAEDIVSSVKEYKISFVNVDGKWLCNDYLFFF